MSDQNLPPTCSPSSHATEWLSASAFRRLARHHGKPMSPAHVTRLIRKGTLPAGKVGQRWYIHREDAEAYLTPQPARPRPTTPITSRQSKRRSEAALARIEAIRAKGVNNG